MWYIVIRYWIKEICVYWIKGRARGCCLTANSIGKGCLGWFAVRLEPAICWDTFQMFHFPKQESGKKHLTGDRKTPLLNCSGHVAGCWQVGLKVVSEFQPYDSIKYYKRCPFITVFQDQYSKSQGTNMRDLMNSPALLTNSSVAKLQFL